MIRTNEGHPEAEQLEAFALGRLGPEEQAELERHVAGCADCCRRLNGVPDDTLLGRLRAGHTPPAGLGSQTSSQAGRTVAGVEAPEELLAHPRYRLLRRLGAGGMGVVYHAVHKLMEREVALKVIHPSLTCHPSAVQRFHLEVKAAAKLQHPNIVTAHDAEQVGELHFLVMEYVEGISLDRLVEKRGPLSVEQACHVIRQAALGLQHAHEKGMVHRDIKPHNIMVTRKGQVKVLDFGLARLAEQAKGAGKRHLTSLGVVLGTPDFIAPEQVSDSHAVDTRADIYSLGCTLYFLLTGRPPFPEGTALEKALAHVDLYPRALAELRPDVPGELLPIVERMMAKTPADRYQTPAEVAQALAGVVRSSGSSSSQTTVVMVEALEVIEAVQAEAPRGKPKSIALPAPARKAEDLPRPRRRRPRRRGSGWLLCLGAAVGLLALVGGSALALYGLGLGPKEAGGASRPAAPGSVQPVTPGPVKKQPAFPAGGWQQWKKPWMGNPNDPCLDN